MQFKHRIPPEHSSLPSTQEHLANIYQVPAVATNQAWNCQETRHDSLELTPAPKLNPDVPAGFAASPRSSAGAERLSKTV